MTAADILACLLLALFAWTLVTGRGHTLHLAGVHIKMTSRLRLAFWSTLVVAVRHLAFPRENLLARLKRLFGSARSRLLSRASPLTGDDYLQPTATGHITASEIVAVTAVMLLLTVAMTYPQIGRLDSVRDLGDPLLAIWRLAWVAHQLPRDPLHLFDGNIYHPAPLTLAYSDSTLLPAILAAPAFWLGVPGVYILNVWILLTFILAGVAMYGLVRWLTRDRAAALVSGVLFAFYPYQFEHYGTTELLFVFWMPLALLAFHRTLAGGRLRDGLMTGGAVAGQLLSGVYLGLFLWAYLVPVAGALALACRGVGRAVKPLMAGALLASALALPMVVPHLQARKLIGERSFSEVEHYSSVPQDYLVADRTRPGWASLLANEPPGAEHSFPGLLILALAAVALVPPLSAPRIAYALGLVFAFEASLGAHGYVFPFLYRVLLPFRGLRCPGRFSICVGLSLAVLAGYGMARLNAHVKRSSRKYLFAIIVCAVGLFESRSVLPLERVPGPDPAYRWFQGREPSVIAELPAVGIEPQWALEARYVYLSTFHWQRIVNGYSGVIPAPYVAFMRAMATFPDAASMRVLRAHRTEYVIVHEESYGRAAYAKLVDAIGRCGDLQEVTAVSRGGYEARMYRLMR